MTFLGYVMYDNFMFILKANCTFMLYLLTINFFSSIIELFRILGMNIPTDKISICLLDLISIISFVAIVAGVICHSQTDLAKYAKYQISADYSHSLHWPIYLTTVLLIFSNNYVIVFMHTAVTLYAIAKGVYKSKDDL